MTAATPLSLFVDKLERHSPLSADARAAILALPHTVSELQKGEYLYLEGEAAPDCCIVLSGYVATAKIAGNGKRQIVAIHMRGDGVGLQNGFVARTDHDAQTLSPVKAAFVAGAAIDELVAGHPDAARAIWLETLLEASIQREWTVNLGARDARSRVAHLLCELAVKQERAATGIKRGYQIALTQEQLAEATGLTAVHINRVLRDLRKDGVIGDVRKGVPLTCDWDRMTEVADFRSEYLEIARAGSCVPAAT
ncbi:Crp/Fnr family transcriptional regulator [Altericroceibacterium xinjiangense]|uniref:Crp/Fnr family transcriptional regulator n=1 Tax=Altericroceibacterium xinjiangense TaxID=762261 RepID=UPI000F7DB76D|nr:Crp/Fnr family transcriptional regulator [Altericroceibacterium xinjiangense]